MIKPVEKFLSGLFICNLFSSIRAVSRMYTVSTCSIFKYATNTPRLIALACIANSNFT